MYKSFQICKIQNITEFIGSESYMTNSVSSHRIAANRAKYGCEEKNNNQSNTERDKVVIMAAFWLRMWQSHYTVHTI